MVAPTQPGRISPIPWVLGRMGTVIARPPTTEGIARHIEMVNRENILRDDLEILEILTIIHLCRH